MSHTKKFKILAIDGGGIRGVFPAQILQCITERLKIDLYESFDMIAGTSTGAIIAAGIAVKKHPSEIVSLYKDKGDDIFGKKISSFWPEKLKQGFHSKYQNENLKKLLKAEFGDTCLGEIKKPLIIPSTDIGNGGVHVFKSNYSPDFTRDTHVALSDAVLASCSAPTFFNPQHVGNYLLADGGVWANNPALIAAIDAKYRLGVDFEDISILSLGTGQSRTAYGTKKRSDWGLLNGWKDKDFIAFILSLQAQSTQNYIKLLFGKEQALRINFESDHPLPLDDTSIISDLLSRADKAFTYESRNLSNFFSD